MIISFYQWIETMWTRRYRTVNILDVDMSHLPTLPTVREPTDYLFDDPTDYFFAEIFDEIIISE